MTTPATSETPQADGAPVPMALAPEAGAVDLAHEGWPIASIVGILVSMLAFTFVVVFMYAFTRSYGPDGAPEAEKRPVARELREADRKALESYGWVDREKKVVRVPIGRAMDLVAREAAKAGSEGARP
jgi:hypothetical protein